MQGGHPPQNCREAFTREGDQVYNNRYYSSDQHRALYLSRDVEEDIRYETCHLTVLVYRDVLSSASHSDELSLVCVLIYLDAFHSFDINLEFKIKCLINKHARSNWVFFPQTFAVSYGNAENTIGALSAEHAERP